MVIKDASVHQAMPMRDSQEAKEGLTTLCGLWHGRGAFPRRLCPFAKLEKPRDKWLKHGKAQGGVDLVHRQGRLCLD